MLIEVLTFSFKKMHINVSSAKWRPSCLGLNVLNLDRESVITPPPPFDVINRAVGIRPRPQINELNLPNIMEVAFT